MTPENIIEKYVSSEHAYLKDYADRYSLPFPALCVVSAGIKTLENQKVVDILKAVGIEVSVELENYLKS